MADQANALPTTSLFATEEAAATPEERRLAQARRDRFVAALFPQPPNLPIGASEAPFCESFFDHPSVQIILPTEEQTSQEIACSRLHLRALASQEACESPVDASTQRRIPINAETPPRPSRDGGEAHEWSQWSCFSVPELLGDLSEVATRHKPLCVPALPRGLEHALIVSRSVGLPGPLVLAREGMR